LVIVLFAIAGILTFIWLTVLGFLIFRRVKPILDSAKGTLGNIQGTSSFVSDVLVKPVIKVVSFATGVRKAMAVVAGLSKRKGGKKGG